MWDSILSSLLSIVHVYNPYLMDAPAEMKEAFFLLLAVFFIFGTGASGRLGASFPNLC